MRTFRPALPCLLTATALVASLALVGAAPASAATARESRVITKINTARANHGLPRLRISPELMAVARVQSRAMAGSQLLFHSTSYSTVCCWSAVAENVGTGYGVPGVHRGLMRSTPHRANILSSRMRQVGVGVVAAGGRIWVTEVFRQPA